MHATASLLLDHIATLTGQPREAIEWDHSLLMQGIDSIGLMRTVNLLRKQGVVCSFESLKQQPTLNAWLALAGAATIVSPAAQPDAPKVDVTQPAPLTPVQQAYWMGRHQDQPLGGNSCQVYIELQGTDICPERLALACKHLIVRHPMLRARFTDRGEQYTPDAADLSPEVYDLRALPEEAVEAQLLGYRHSWSHYCADIRHDGPLRIALSRLPAGRSRLHINLDLLVADVLSISIMLRDLAAFYRHDAPSLRPLPHHFFQYHQLYLQESRARYLQAREWWQQRLPALPGAPALPLVQQPGMLTRPQFTRRDYLLKSHQLNLLEHKARQHNVTLATVFLTLYCEVLARWSESKHFLLNVPLFNRHDLLPGVPDMVADFTSLLLLEVDFRQPATFARRLHQLQAQLHRDIAHADYSGVDVLRDLARADGDAPRTAPVVFALNLGQPFIPDEAGQALGELHWMISQTPQVWIDHQSYPTREGLLLNWDSVDALFPENMVSSMFSSWLARLHLLIEQPWDAIPDVTLPPASQATRSRMNATALSIPSARLHDGFFTQAQTRPDAPAVITDTGAVSYATLEKRALQIALALQRQGVKSQDVVAINLPKGSEQLAAVLGVLAAGASWLPLAVEHPLARRAMICARAEVTCVITLPGEMWPETLNLLHPDASSETAEKLSAPLPGSDEQRAYIIYTSGSTGEPKGVAVSHRAAWNTLATLNQRFMIGNSDRVLALSGLEFDLSVYDIFGLLSAGGALVMPREDQRRDPDAWRDLAHQHGVTLWNSVPALLEMLLLTSPGEALLPSLRQAWVSGDRVAPDLAARLRQRLTQPVRVIAMGGATEAAVWSNAYEILPDYDATSRVPYGFPLANQQFRVMDENHMDCPDWVAGELWIGGTGVAQGYHGDVRQTAARFVSDRGQRWYRTGDRGFYSPDGLLHFLGRLDNQVKVEGNRIEPGEIESALEQHTGITTAICLVVNQRLEAVFTAGHTVSVEPLLTALALKLPAYMVPKRLQQLDSLPLTANGKVDRAALSRWLASHSSAMEVAEDEGSNTLHPLLRSLWQEQLQLTQPDFSMTFFQAGGNSLDAMRLVNRINQALGIQLTLREFLTHATLSALTTFINSTYPAAMATEEGAL